MVTEASSLLPMGRVLGSYAALRAYAGKASAVHIADPLLGGLFSRDEQDNATADNGVTVIVSTNGKRWKRMFTGAVCVEWFGAKGDGVTNDIAAFVAAMRYAQTVPGSTISYGDKGQVYRIAYTSTYPAIVIPTRTTFVRAGGGYLLIDPTLLPAAAPSGGSANWVPAYGEITTGNALTLQRPGAGYSGGAPLNGFIVNNFDPNTACYDINIINPKLVCTWAGMLTSTQRCYGIRMWFCYDSTIHSPHIEGMPHSGLMWSGGDRNATTGVTVVRENGKKCPAGVSRNGYNAIGILCLNQPNFTTRSHTVGDVIADENQDEGFQFANTGKLVVRSVVGKGNRDRLIEGDTSFDTTQTAASLGQEIPNEVIIGGVIFDGSNSDGGVALHGISIACGNEGRVSLGTVRIRNMGTGLSSEGTPVSISFNNGGSVSIDGVVLENCKTPANYHAVYVKASRVDIRTVSLNNCNGTSNSAVVAVVNADVAYVSDVDADTGFIHGVRFDGTVAARKLSVKRVSVRGLVKSFVYLALAARAELVDVKDCQAEGINTGAALDQAFVTIGNAAFRCGTLTIEDNRCRVAQTTAQPLTILGGVTLPVGAIDKARFRRNDFDDEAMFNQTGTQTARCWNNFGNQITDYAEFNNHMPGQRERIATAVPTTGTWGKGDTVRMHFPDAGTVSEYRCTTPGTFATVTGVTATTVAGQSTATLSDASNVVPGSWISMAGVTASGGTVTGYLRVLAKTGNVVRFSLTLDQSLSNVAVSNLTPVFKGLTLAA